MPVLMVRRQRMSPPGAATDLGVVCMAEGWRISGVVFVYHRRKIAECYFLCSSWW
jgi:hypothetical protein